MPGDVRQEGLRNLEAVQTTNRGLLERALQMRAASYLAQQKANLLTQTIFEIDRSKQELRDHSRALVHNEQIIQKQKAELEARTAALEEIQRTLEDRVRKRTQELERANAALREEAIARQRAQSEREELSEKYLRAQKLELVGRLAGGVAHDFNNLLTVIMGHGELARSTAAWTAVAEHLQAIVDASRRGAALTSQLLSFAGKQSRTPTVIDPAAVIEEFARLLRRVLGDAVLLELQLEAACGNVRAGVSELEQILLNLVVNARDAMPHGGTISVSLRGTSRPIAGPAPHGPCVVLEVRDTGEGMSDEVLVHAFEPFFTTKPAGIGTGLGLATVESIVRDCGGRVDVDSSVGAGTTFHIYLPVVAEASEPRGVTYDADALPRGREAVLVVDDDDSVLTVLRSMLQMLGYRVLCADRAATALQILRRERVDLMLADSVMPGASGEALEAEVAQRWPTTRVVLMSGYADRPRPRDAQGGRLPFLDKPIDLKDLAFTLRRVLDSASASAVGSAR